MIGKKKYCVQKTKWKDSRNRWDGIVGTKREGSGKKEKVKKDVSRTKHCKGKSSCETWLESQLSLQNIPAPFDFNAKLHLNVGICRNWGWRAREWGGGGEGGGEIDERTGTPLPEGGGLCWVNKMRRGNRKIANLAGGWCDVSSWHNKRVTKVGPN